MDKMKQDQEDKKKFEEDILKELEELFEEEDKSAETADTSFSDFMDLFGRSVPSSEDQKMERILRHARAKQAYTNDVLAKLEAMSEGRNVREARFLSKKNKKGGGGTVAFREGCRVGQSFNFENGLCTNYASAIEMPEECTENDASNANCIDKNKPVGTPKWKSFDMKVTDDTTLDKLIDVAVDVSAGGKGFELGAEVGFVKSN